MNSIENAKNLMKNELEKSRPISISDLKEVLKKIWITMDSAYLTKFASSMSKMIQMVLKNKGDMTKY